MTSRRVSIKGTDWEGVIYNILPDDTIVVKLDDGMELRCDKTRITCLDEKYDCNTKKSTAERDEQGRFVAGHKKLGGIKKGKSGVRQIRRELIDQLQPFISNMGEIIAMIDDPAEKVLAVSRMMKFTVPTYSEYVIDGQQRLTTSIIFFSAFINTLKHRESEWINSDEVDVIKGLMDDISDYYLKDIRRERQKFITVPYDNNFFADVVIDHKNNVSQEDLSSKSKIAIYNALIYFEEELANATIEELLSWTSSLENASITTFIVKDKLQAAQIFAYQNDRGKKLTNLEVLKAYFMLQIYHSQNNEDNIIYVEKAFEEIYHHIVLVTVEEDNVLNYYWRAIGPKGYYSENVVREVKSWLKTIPQEQQTKHIKEFVNGLSKAFSLILQIEQDNSFYTANLKNLRNMAYAYPMLIKAKLSDVTEEVFQRLIKLLENLTFRSLIRGGRADITSRLQNVLPYAKDTQSFNQMIDSIVWKLKNDWWWGYWSDKEMLNNLNSGWFYGNRVDNYLLWRYEQYLCNDNYPTPKITYGEVISNESIEHIAPQTQTNPIENGYGIYEDIENPSEGITSGNWLNCVGNLMLMAGRQNSSLGNRPFPQKLEVYGKDNLLNQQKEIIDFVIDKNNPVWDKASIERRFNKIIQAAKDIWNLDKI